MQIEKKQFLFIEKVSNLVLFLYILSIYIISNQGGLNRYSNLTLIILAVPIIIYIMMKRKITIGSYNLYSFFYIVFSSLSLNYSISTVEASNKLRTISLIFGLTILIYNYIDGEEKLELALKFIAWSGILTCIYLIISTGGVQLLQELAKSERIGDQIGQVNTFGFYLTISTLISFYFALYKKKSKYLFISIVCFIFALISGSRKALIGCFIGVAMLIVLRTKRKRIASILLSIIFFVIVFYIISNIPIFKVVMDRFYTMLNIFSEQETDASTEIRRDLIIAGWMAFKARPMMGYGLDNSRFIMQALIGRGVYTHNNYMEILVNSGVIGFIIYYIPIVLYMSYLSTEVWVKKNEKLVIYFVISLVYIILDFGMVSYAGKINRFFWVLVNIAIVINKRRNSKAVLD